jgi:hypothetical protein
MRLGAVCALVLAGLASPLAAAPPPAAVPSDLPPLPPPVLIQPYLRVNRYEVWQNYGVDFQGRFRPRVIYTSDGPFYYYNGARYPGASVNQLYYMPYATD